VSPKNALKFARRGRVEIREGIYLFPFFQGSAWLVRLGRSPLAGWKPWGWRGGREPARASTQPIRSLRHGSAERTPGEGEAKAGLAGQPPPPQGNQAVPLGLVWLAKGTAWSVALLASFLSFPFHFSLFTGLTFLCTRAKSPGVRLK